jgi:hypothetical protein
MIEDVIKAKTRLMACCEGYNVKLSELRSMIEAKDEFLEECRKLYQPFLDEVGDGATIDTVCRFCKHHRENEDPPCEGAFMDVKCLYDDLEKKWIKALKKAGIKFETDEGDRISSVQLGYGTFSFDATIAYAYIDFNTGSSAFTDEYNFITRTLDEYTSITINNDNKVTFNYECDDENGSYEIALDD